MIKIRTMQEDDLDEAARIEKENFSRPWSRQAFRESVFRKDTLYLAAEDNGCIAGYVGMWISLDEGEITNVSVDRTRQGQGIGRRLLKGLLQEAARQGVRSCVLEVRESNVRAIGLYESLGFTGLGIRRNFYEAPVEDGIVMGVQIAEEL